MLHVTSRAHLLVVIHHLDAAPLCRDDPGADGHVELPARRGLDPYVVPLWVTVGVRSRLCSPPEGHRGGQVTARSWVGHIEVMGRSC